jgi:ABC-type Na+ efflux pump permease subunit
LVKEKIIIELKRNLSLLVPFIFLGILNTLIVSRLRARQHTSIQRSATSSSAAKTDSTIDSASTRKRQRQKNTDRNITFMLIAVAIAFMVMSFPFQ